MQNKENDDYANNVFIMIENPMHQCLNYANCICDHVLSKQFTLLGFYRNTNIYIYCNVAWNVPW